MCYRHVDGQWVTWRQAMQDDVSVARKAWENAGLTIPELPGKWVTE